MNRAHVGGVWDGDRCAHRPRPKYLEGLSSLQELDLEGTKVTDARIKTFQQRNKGFRTEWH